ARARLDAAAASISDRGERVEIVLPVSRPLPYRAFLLADPPRLVLDFAELDFTGTRAAALDRSDAVAALGWGPIKPGWTRLVAELTRPMAIERAEERAAGTGAEGAVIRLSLRPATGAEFAALTATPPEANPLWDLPRPAPTATAKRRQRGAAPLVVVLDPGHGGIDPGAEAAGLVEADIMLVFARELAQVLRQAGMRAVLTREEDVFVPLEARISLARAAGADVLLSLHADALAEGEATGATLYKLSETASDRAAALLAERHDRADLLSGVDLSGQDDLVATVLMDLARQETAPRVDRLARAVLDAFAARGIRTHRHPIQGAAFSVLKAPDIPSLLIEVGFLSSDRDRARLVDPDWRARAQAAIRDALAAWAVEDAAEARGLRR
ncbi:N-acetylmuramoyl-L-alanine amidase, partial [Albidovulum sp.]